MQLREIHIDGFGIIRDKHVIGISSGTNVLYGPNEFGKSTLLEFVRRILFGFRGVNPYSALSGGVYGGRLVCELANGKIITISRKEGRLGGPVKISGDSVELAGQEELNKILGLISQKFYDNIYAIGLDELQTIKTLEEEEIRNHIYGAGLGLGSTSLKEISDTFSKQAEEVFKPGGSAQLMPGLYRDIREKERAIGEARKYLSEYDGLVTKDGELQGAIELIGTQITKAEADQRLLQAQNKLFPTYVVLKGKEDRLAEIPETTLFHEDALTALERLETVTSNLEMQMTRDARDLKQSEQIRGSLIYDEAIIGLEASISSLQKRSEQFKSASTDITILKAQKTTATDNIRGKIERLGKGWTEEKIRRFNLSVSQEDQSRIAKDEISDAKRVVESIRSKLEAHRDSRVGQAVHGARIPTLIKIAGYTSMALGISGIALGITMSQLLLSVFSACLLIIGLVVIVNTRNESAAQASDPLEKKYTGDLSTAESAYATVLTQWQAQLDQIGFDQNLSPDGALDVSRTIREIQTDLAAMKELDSRIESMQNSIGAVDALLNQVISTLGEAKINDDTIASIEILNQRLGTAKAMKGKRESLEDRINESTGKVKIDEDSTNKAKEELRQYVSSFGAQDENDFRIKNNMFREYEKLKKEIEESKTIIRSTVGTGQEYESFMTSISLTNPTAIEAELESTKNTLTLLKTQLDQNNRIIGEVRTRIKDLSSKDPTVEQTELETKKQQLRDSSAGWVRSQIALFALEKAISKYENTRQPEVIKAAAGVFARITDHAYEMIIKPAEISPGKSTELSIQDISAKRKTIDELSRGTKEQLYLAMRLGLIKAYEIESEPMPIVMDDILANFDDSRGLEAIKALIEFSNTRQTIILTCHRDNFDLYKHLGANEIRLG